jgi:hypothetical protein
LSLGEGLIVVVAVGGSLVFVLFLIWLEWRLLVGIYKTIATEEPRTPDRPLLEHQMSRPRRALVLAGGGLILLAGLALLFYVIEEPNAGAMLWISALTLIFAGGYTYGRALLTASG